MPYQLTLDLNNTWTGGNVQYVVVANSQLTSNVGQSPAILQNSVSSNITGNLNPNGTSTVTHTITASSDTPVTIFFIANTSNPDFTTGSFTLSNPTVTISPITESVILYKNRNLNQNNPTTGELAWDSLIPSIELDFLNREIISPNGLIVFNVAKGYRRWHDFVEENIEYLRFGIPMEMSNQSKPSNVINNSHLYYPQSVFQFGWRLDVLAGRNTAVAFEISASLLERNDADNSGLVYNSPLANGNFPALKYVTNSASEFQAQTEESLGNLVYTMNSILPVVNKSLQILKDNLE